MSEPINDGGPAYPCVVFHGDEHNNPEYSIGMSLRDWFAGQALAGMHARDTYDRGQAEPEQRAHLAYIDADAMLKERTQ